MPLKLSVIVLMITAILAVTITATQFIGRAWIPSALMAITDQTEGATIVEAGSNQILASLSVGSMDRLWSPVARQVAVISHWGSAERLREVYVYDLDSGGLRNISNHPASDSSPAWSPDGRRIAFVSWRDGNAEIYVASLDGDDLMNISSHPASDILPVWSPDGRRIAFVSERDSNYEIYVVDADGGNLRNLSRSPANDTSPVWSPTGEMIAFVSMVEGSSEIMIADVRTNVVHRLSGSHQRILSLVWN